MTMRSFWPLVPTINARPGPTAGQLSLFANHLSDISWFRILRLDPIALRDRGQLHYTIQDELPDLAGPLGLDLETMPNPKLPVPPKSAQASLDPLLGQIRLVSIATPDAIYLFDLANPDPIPTSYWHHTLVASQPLVIIHNASFELAWLYCHWGLILDRFWCTCTASRCIEYHTNHDLGSVLARSLGIVREDKGPGQLHDWTVVLTDDHIRYAALDVCYLYDLYQQQLKELEATDRRYQLPIGQTCQLARYDMAVLPMLALAELTGLPISQPLFQQLVKEEANRLAELDLDAARLLHELRDPVESPALINLNAKQAVLARLKRAVPKLRSMRQAHLQAHRNDHPAISAYLAWNHQASRLRYLTKLRNRHPMTDRVHTSYRILVTGRIQSGSTGAPWSMNLQQIPGEARYRQLFRLQGWKAIDLDYSNCEKRILAWYSRDPNLLEMFQSGRDVHSFTAALMYGEPYEDFLQALAKRDDARSDQALSERDRKLLQYRDEAKMIGFGRDYGASAERIAEERHLPLEQVRDSLARYEQVFAVAMKFLADCGTEADRTGYTRPSFLGRVRDLAWEEAWLRQHNRRPKASRFTAGMNWLQQAGNADLLKVALADAWVSLEPWIQQRQCTPIWPIHDEILLFAVPELVPVLVPLLTQAMLTAAHWFIDPNVVPMVAQARSGDSWGDAH